VDDAAIPSAGVPLPMGSRMRCTLPVGVETHSALRAAPPSSSAGAHAQQRGDARLGTVCQLSCDDSASLPHGPTAFMCDAHGQWHVARAVNATAVQVGATVPLVARVGGTAFALDCGAQAVSLDTLRASSLPSLPVPSPPLLQCLQLRTSPATNVAATYCNDTLTVTWRPVPPQSWAPSVVTSVGSVPGAVVVNEC